VYTVAAAQMGGEGSMAHNLSIISRGLILKSAGGEVSAFKSEQHAYGVVAEECGAMERCVSICPCFVLVCASLH
jgi:hypothetical protein